MLKRFLFAVAPMLLFAGSVMANDSLLSTVAKMDLNKADTVAPESAELDDLGQADVDALLGDGEEAAGEDAIAACFRRIGWGYRGGCGYRSYGRYSYRSWYRPCYRTYYSYPAVSCYRPVCHSYYTPVYTNYWGCW